MKRNSGVALLIVLILTMLLAAMAGALVTFGQTVAKASRASVWHTKAFYSAEGALAQSLVNLRLGGSGELVGSTNGVPYTVTTSDDDGTTLIHVLAHKDEEPGAHYELNAWAVPIVIDIPQVAAIYTEPGSTLTLNGDALTLDGDTTFALATAYDEAGENYEALMYQIDVDRYDQLQGLEEPGSIGDVDPIDVPALFASLKASPWGGIVHHEGNLRLSGNLEGSGVLLVSGDLSIAGSYTFDGLVIVLGDVKLTGGGDSLSILGALLTAGDFIVSGSVEVLYDGEILTELETLVNEATTALRLVAQVSV